MALSDARKRRPMQETDAVGQHGVNKRTLSLLPRGLRDLPQESPTNSLYRESWQAALGSSPFGIRQPLSHLSADGDGDKSSS